MRQFPKQSTNPHVDALVTFAIIFVVVALLGLVSAVTLPTSADLNSIYPYSDTTRSRHAR